MDNQTDVSIKFKNYVTGEKKLEKYAQTLNQIKSVLGSIDKGAAQQLESSAKSTKSVSNDMDKMSKNFNLAFNYTALRTFARGLSKVVEGFSAMTSKSTAFLEDFNLFQVAFRGNYTEATRFVNKLSEMYGLDEDWLVKTTSQFKQLSNAMGLAEETGEKVSKLMTELAIDISSLYNIDVDRSSSILQSALAGQTKPIRSLGADITQATLQQTLDNLDIQKQISQLSYAEKRLLIMVSITQQLSGVTNDWGRTLESPSNQIRIMNEQWQRLQRNVGNIFIATLGKVLPYLNAVLMVLNEIAKIIASLLGYKLDQFDFFDESAIGNVEDFGESLDAAAESAEKLKSGLRGFDKLNVISSQTSSGAGATGGINPKLMEAFNNAFADYQNRLTDVEMKATKIRDRIMEWLGFTKKVDKETGEISFKFDHITGGTVLGALAVGGTIYSGINMILKVLNKIGLIKFANVKELIVLGKEGKLFAGVTKLTGAFEGLAATLGISTGLLAGIVVAILAVGAALLYAYNTNEDFKNSVDTFFKDLYTIIEPAVKLFTGTIYDTFSWLFDEITTIVGGTVKVLDDLIKGDFDKAFDDFTKTIEDVWKSWDEYWTKITIRFDKWIDDTINSINNFIPKAIEKLEEFNIWLDKLPEKFGEIVGMSFRSFYEKVKEKSWKEIALWILNEIGNVFLSIPQKILNFPQNLFNYFMNKIWQINWGDIGKAIVDGIFNGMWDFKGKIGKWASGFITGLKNGLGIHSPAQLIIDAKIGDYSMDAIMVGMERQLPMLREEATDIVNTLRNGIKDASVDAQYNYNVPNLNLSSMAFGTQSLSDSSSIGTSINPTIIVQVGNKEIAKQVITDLQDMAKDNGSPIMIGG